MRRPPKTIELIKALYPTPVAVYEDDGSKPGGYCVGGAFCLFNGVKAFFPTVAQLRDMLMHVNPKLSRQDAKIYASQIMFKNDHDEFDHAWVLLGRALEYGRS